MALTEPQELNHPLIAVDIPDDLPETVIRPSKGWAGLNFRELWQYRELLYFLAWRDIKVKYKQAALGAAWALIQPFMTMVAFSFFFGNLAGVESDGLPYPIFAYAALIPWTFFASGLTQAANSLVADANLLRKIYFPRLISPLAAVVAVLPDFFLAFLILIGMMVIYGIFPSAVAVLLLIPLTLLAFITAFGVGLWLAALNVEYRDVRYTLGFLVQFWLFITPIAYPSSLLSEPWRTLYGLNPMAGVVEGFRWVLLGSGRAADVAPPGPMIFVSALVAVLVLIGGLFYFRRMERRFGDVI
ncbi:MAG: ABC transporter permease [bacterium]|nr:ABC transporter permease [bacterium]